MDIIVVIIVIICVIRADKKKKAKQAQGNAKRESIPSAGTKRAFERTENTIYDAADHMQKNMTQTQRELKERLQKKYGSSRQQTKAIPPNSRSKCAAGSPKPHRQPALQTKEARQDVEENLLNRAVANVQEEAVDELKLERSREPAADGFDLAAIEETPLMQQVSGLMVTGYTGALSFERDFVAEGVEMLNRCEMIEA